MSMTVVAALLLAATMFLAGCYTGPGADHFDAVLDELSIPEGWSLAKAEVRGPGEEIACDPFESSGCPAAIRTYVTDGGGDVAFAQAKDILTEAGFAIEDGAAPDCSTGPTTGLPCYLFSQRGGDYLTVAVHVSPEAAGLDDETPGATTVVVRVSED